MSCPVFSQILIVHMLQFLMHFDLLAFLLDTLLNSNSTCELHYRKVLNSLQVGSESMQESLLVMALFSLQTLCQNELGDISNTKAEEICLNPGLVSRVALDHASAWLF